MPSHSYYAAAVMLELLRDAAITIELRDLGPLILGEVDFRTRTISISSSIVEPGQFRATFVHELVHLVRGPCHQGKEHDEEETVAMQTAAMLVPPEFIPDQATPREIAESFLVDEDLARVALGLKRARTGEVA